MRRMFIKTPSARTSARPCANGDAHEVWPRIRWLPSATADTWNASVASEPGGLQQRAATPKRRPWQRYGLYGRPARAKTRSIPMKTTTELRYLQDMWDAGIARHLDEPELLRYRSNLLGADLRITNFGGGNTSSKITQPDPLDGRDQTVLWVKGSGGDLGSIARGGFATLYLEKLLALEHRYR